MDGHGDEEHDIGNAVSINTLARWRVREGKEQLRVPFYKLYKCLTNVPYT